MFLGDSYISGSVHTQLMLFLMAMVWGAAIALAYDGLRVSRQLMPLPRWLYFAEDFLFWIVEALMIYRLMFQYDNGAIRSYTMFGMLSGMALYLWIFGRWLSKAAACFLGAVINWMKKILGFIFSIVKILLTPFRWVFGNMWRIAVKKSRNLKKCVNLCLKLLKKTSKKGKMGIVQDKQK